MREPFNQSPSKNTFEVPAVVGFLRRWWCSEITTIPLYTVVSVAPASATKVPAIFA